MPAVREDSDAMEQSSEQIESPQPGEETEDLELIYDPILNCYFDPTNNKYYELKTEPLLDSGGRRES
ncbi:hypothetical protein T484DRAFT_1828599 [Baffinella frigidus]|nr:hypothetical protein T484DRAFT_1828599 [Cryptophyta sp. CCMP2293]